MLGMLGGGEIMSENFKWLFIFTLGVSLHEGIGGGGGGRQNLSQSEAGGF